MKEEEEEEEEEVEEEEVEEEEVKERRGRRSRTIGYLFVLIKQGAFN